jgi:hypothetical protein
MEGAAAVLAGRRLSPPPARPPAVGKKRAGRRRTLCKCCGWKNEGELGFLGFICLIYTSEIGGVILNR